jgi:dTDP-4-dehydrorhamnose reductase
MRVLVTGATGMLGRKLVSKLREASEEVFAASRRVDGPWPPGTTPVAMDVTNGPSVASAVQQARPEVVIHAAAIADVDLCEREPALAEAVNAVGTAHVVDACREAGSRLVYVSTDYVFDGNSGPYREDDPVGPLSVYGRTKLVGEQAAASLSGSVIARTAVLFGQAPAGRSNLVLWLLERLKNGVTAPAATDQSGSPTLVDNLADMLLAFATNEQQGVFHAAGATVTDRYSFCRVAAAAFGYDPDLVQPVQSTSISRPARRPVNSGLLVDKVAAALPQAPPLTANESLAVLRRQLSLA